MLLRHDVTIKFIQYQYKYWSMIYEMGWSTPPKSPGKASPSIIYANYYDYSDTVRVSVPPTGGSPTFTYSWYTSTNGTAWAEKQRGGDFIPQFDRNGYIKCRFASNGVYVESNTIKVLYPVNPGIISTIDSWIGDSDYVDPILLTDDQTARWD